MTLTRLVWRKKNLATFRLAASARARNSEILAQAEPRFIPPTFPMLGQFEPDERTPEELSAAREEAKEQAREELGETLQLVEMGNDATVERFFEELSVVDRIDSMIDRCIKRLLMVRGVKSMSVSPRRKPSLSGKRRAA